MFSKNRIFRPEQLRFHWMPMESHRTSFTKTWPGTISAGTARSKRWPKRLMRFVLAAWHNENRFQGNETELLSQLMDKFNLKLIALTKGANGSLLVTGNEQSFMEVPMVEIADSVGAGDSFTGNVLTPDVNVF